PHGQDRRRRLQRRPAALHERVAELRRRESHVVLAALTALRIRRGPSGARTPRRACRETAPPEARPRSAEPASATDATRRRPAPAPPRPRGATASGERVSAAPPSSPEEYPVAVAPRSQPFTEPSAPSASRGAARFFAAC